jgi:hypothetical protein
MHFAESRDGFVAAVPGEKGTCTGVQVLAISERWTNLAIRLAAAFAKVSDGLERSGVRGCLSGLAKY